MKGHQTPCSIDDELAYAVHGLLSRDRTAGLLCVEALVTTGNVRLGSTAVWGASLTASPEIEAFLVKLITEHGLLNDPRYEELQDVVDLSDFSG